KCRHAFYKQRLQTQQTYELGVPGHQPEIGVEGAERARHVLQNAQLQVVDPSHFCVHGVAGGHILHGSHDADDLTCGVAYRFTHEPHLELPALCGDEGHLDVEGLALPAGSIECCHHIVALAFSEKLQRHCRGQLEIGIDLADVVHRRGPGQTPGRHVEL